MRDELARYAIGVALGAAIGALLVWRIAHDDADRILADWERAAIAQQDAARRRTARIHKETVDGLVADRTELRRRLAAGWRPTLHAAAGVPAGRVPDAACRTDGAAAPRLSDPAGTETDAERLRICDAQRDRLIADGQETVLRYQRLQGWVEKVSGKTIGNP